VFYTDTELREFKQLLKTYLFIVADMAVHKDFCFIMHHV